MAAIIGWVLMTVEMGYSFIRLDKRTDDLKCAVNLKEKITFSDILMIFCGICMSTCTFTLAIIAFGFAIQAIVEWVGAFF